MNELIKTLGVIVPILDGLHFVDRCLESLTSQEEIDEIIIVDGGSTDGSYPLLLNWAQRDDRIQVVQLPDTGVSACRNLGIRTANSRWISFCDIDDYYLPLRFEAFAQADKSDIDVFHTAVKSVYEHDSLRSSIQEVTSCPKDFSLPEELQNHLISQSEEGISIISVIARKEALEHYGMFDESLHIGEDTDLIWRLASRTNFIYEHLEPARVVRHVHRSNTYQDEEKVISGRLAFYRKWRSSAHYRDLEEKAKRRIREGLRYYRYMYGYKYGSVFFQSAHRFRYLTSKLLRI